MCSGCSGNYAGDFESPGEYLLDYDYISGIETGITRSVDVDRYGSEAPRRACSSDTSSRVLRHNSNFLPAFPADQPAPAMEQDWEVLVSAQQIVEIHFLGGPRCDPAECSDSNHNEVATALANQHFPRRSAKYYRTSTEVGSHEGGQSHISLLMCSLGAVAAALLALWRLLS